MNEMPTSQAVSLSPTDPGYPFGDEIRAYILACEKLGMRLFWADAAAEIRAAKERAVEEK